MTGPTHKEFSVTAALLTSIGLYSTGLISEIAATSNATLANPDINNLICYYALIPTMTTIAAKGALFPDIDHEWKNVKEKTMPNRILNGLIHFTGGKHRSWQTHSIDLVIIFSLLAWFVPRYLYLNQVITFTVSALLQVISYAFMSGWVSHIFSDMLNGVGVRITCLSKKKVALVPRHIGKLKFNTGNEWEGFVYKLVHTVNIPLGIFTLLFPALPTIERFIHSIIQI